MKLGILDTGVIILYLLLMVGVAVFFARKKIENFDDYFLAGGKLSVPILIATLTSTYFGVDSLTANSEMGFGIGISGFFSYCFVASVMMIILAFVGFSIKEKLGDAKTSIEIIANTYGPISRISCAVGSLCYTIPVVNIMGMGIAFSIVLGVEFWVGVLISAVISTVFTYYGGLTAVSITDTLNFMIIAVGVAIAGILGWQSIGSENIWNGLEIFVGGDPSFYFNPTGGWLTAGLLITYAITAISVLCEPTLFQRIFAAKDGASVRKALFIGAFIYLSYAVVSTLIGVLAAAGVGLGTIPEIAASEALFSFGVQYLPIGILGLFFAGFLAAGISTCDSMLLVAGSNISYDLYVPFSKKQQDQKGLISVTKKGILLASVISVILSFAFGRVMGAWVFVSSMLVNTTLIPFYTALFIKGRKSKLAGEVSSGFGMVGTLLYYFGIAIFGYYSEDWGTYMLDISLFGKNVTLWQEYNILVILPITFILYFAIHFITRPNKKEAK